MVNRLISASPCLIRRQSEKEWGNRFVNNKRQSVCSRLFNLLWTISVKSTTSRSGTLLMCFLKNNFLKGLIQLSSSPCTTYCLRFVVSLHWCWKLILSFKNIWSLLNSSVVLEMNCYKSPGKKRFFVSMFNGTINWFCLLRAHDLFWRFCAESSRLYSFSL